MTQSIVTKENLSAVMRFNAGDRSVDFDYEHIRKKIAQLDFIENPPVAPDTLGPLSTRILSHHAVFKNANNPELSKFAMDGDYPAKDHTTTIEGRYFYFPLELKSVGPLAYTAPARYLAFSFNFFKHADQYTRDLTIARFNGLAISFVEGQNAIRVPNHSCRVYLNGEEIKDSEDRTDYFGHMTKEVDLSKMHTLVVVLYNNHVADTELFQPVTNFNFYGVQDTAPDLITELTRDGLEAARVWNLRDRTQSQDEIDDGTSNDYTFTNMYDFHKKFSGQPVSVTNLSDLGKTFEIPEETQVSITTEFAIFDNETILNHEKPLGFIGQQGAQGVTFFKKSTERSTEGCFVRHELPNWRVYLDGTELKSHTDYRVPFGKVQQLIMVYKHETQTPSGYFEGYINGVFINSVIAGGAATPSALYAKFTESGYNGQFIDPRSQINDEIVITNSMEHGYGGINLTVHRKAGFNGQVFFTVKHKSFSGTADGSTEVRDGWIMAETRMKTGSAEVSRSTNVIFTEGGPDSINVPLGNTRIADGEFTVTQTNSNSGTSEYIFLHKENYKAWVYTRIFPFSDDFTDFVVTGKSAEFLGAGSRINVVVIDSKNNTSTVETRVKADGTFEALFRNINLPIGRVTVLVYATQVGGLDIAQQRAVTHFYVPNKRNIAITSMYYIPVSDPTKRTFYINLTGYVAGKTQIKAILSKFTGAQRGTEGDVVRVYLNNVLNRIEHYFTFTTPISVENAYLEIEFTEESGYVYTREFVLNTAEMENATGNIYPKEDITNGRIVYTDNNRLSNTATVKLSMVTNPAYSAGHRSGRRFVLIYQDETGKSYATELVNSTSTDISIPIEVTTGRSIVPAVKLLVLARSLETVEETITQIATS